MTKTNLITTYLDTMMCNTFGKAFSIITRGNSHGPAICVVIDGCPPGLKLTNTDIQLELDADVPDRWKSLRIF